ncbi:class I SAM-dependent methyltransferase [Limnochorda pilosa]|uniref:Methyltransferase type 11 n=1 Tax=Limnochorda pilosa TaxID=1555112 RepID=A0A0K2SKL9_LIMPI|nr:class I SAM-dependent methyltransferase [Limnochorda pilosa]BAS27404.1 methyltransferase type 11 [Limnochorda pilosa]
MDDDLQARTEKARRRYDRHARTYDHEMGFAKRLGMARWRRLLWEGVSGRVLKVGVGTGLNFPYYPEEARVTAVDFSPAMLEKARRKAETLGGRVDLRLMDAQALDFPDASFDAAVTSCVFCSVPDPILGLREIRRVLKPGRELRMLEHVRSHLPVVGRVMDWVNPLAVAISGANINRETVAHLRRAGLEVQEVRPLLADIFLLIRARRPAEDRRSSPPGEPRDGPSPPRSPGARRCEAARLPSPPRTPGVVERTPPSRMVRSPVAAFPTVRSRTSPVSPEGTVAWGRRVSITVMSVLVGTPFDSQYVAVCRE